MASKKTSVRLTDDQLKKLRCIVLATMLIVDFGGPSRGWRKVADRRISQQMKLLSTLTGLSDSRLVDIVIEDTFRSLGVRKPN